MPHCAPQRRGKRTFNYCKSCERRAVPGMREPANEPGNLAILKYAHENGCPWDARTGKAAASGWSLECLTYAHEHGCPWEEEATKCAPANGNIDLLQYAHENGCPWDAGVYFVAAAADNVQAFQYAHLLGCPFDTAAVALAAYWCSPDTLEYCLKRNLATNVNLPALVASILIVNASTERMEAVMAHNRRRDNFQPRDKAVQEAQFKCLQLAFHYGCVVEGNQVCTLAAAASLPCLKLAHEHGCPWDKDTCAAAALTDKLDCLQYLRTHGCRWDIGTVRAAMEGGALSCLKYAHGNGCEWDCRLADAQVH